MHATSPFSLENKTALVCGASKGIGRATALELAKLGAKVHLLARTESSLHELQNEMASLGLAQGECLALDMENSEELRSRVEQILVTKGPIHILINNSGGPSPGPALKADPQEFVSGMKRHIFAAQTLVQCCLPGMEAQSFGRIINVISTSVKEPLPNLGVSNTLRGAMASWAKTVAMELPRGVTINNILPGYTNTHRLKSLVKATAEKRGCSTEQVEKEWIQTIPEGRFADAQEIAYAICFLASPAASYVRGISLAVDGGRIKSL
jgi:3-oxoacyl-[acyl-carrier protein] reductase